MGDGGGGEVVGVPLRPDPSLRMPSFSKGLKMGHTGQGSPCAISYGRSLGPKGQEAVSHGVQSGTEPFLGVRDKRR